MPLKSKTSPAGVGTLSHGRSEQGQQNVHPFGGDFLTHHRPLNPSNLHPRGSFLQLQEMHGQWWRRVAGMPILRRSPARYLQSPGGEAHGSGKDDRVGWDEREHKSLQGRENSLTNFGTS